MFKRALPYVSGMLLGEEGSSVLLALSRAGPSSYSSTPLVTSYDTREAGLLGISTCQPGSYPAPCVD